jgi:hypothetical protein
VLYVVYQAYKAMRDTCGGQFSHRLFNLLGRHTDGDDEPAAGPVVTYEKPVGGRDGQGEEQDKEHVVSIGFSDKAVLIDDE